MRLRDSLGTGLAALHTVVITFAMYVTWENYSRVDYWLWPLIVDFPVSLPLMLLTDLSMMPFSGLSHSTQNFLAWLFTFGWSLVGGGAWWFVIGWWLHGPTDPTAPNPALERTPTAGDAGSASDAHTPQ